MRKLVDLLPVRFNDKKSAVVWLDQTKIPFEEVWKESIDVDEFEKAIKTLEIRGAPTIGVYAAYCVASIALNVPASETNFIKYIRKNAERIGIARPTAVNLSWAVNKMLKRMDALGSKSKLDVIGDALLDEAKKIDKSEYECGKKIGEQGSSIIQDGDTIFSRCNAGMIACAGSGTSYAVIRKAWQEGKNISVVIPHTAPLYQGARLTVWECERDGIPVTLVADDMVAYMMSTIKTRKLVLLGADRILINGDTANKIGTMQDAVLAKHYNIPFYVAAPTSTIDPVSKEIPIEMRNPEELKVLLGKLPVTTKTAKAMNPAFDVTPNTLITGIITEKGIAKAPYTKSLGAMKKVSAEI